MIEIRCVCVGNKPLLIDATTCANPAHARVHDPNLHSHLTVTTALIRSWLTSRGVVLYFMMRGGQ
jgi:hypothetical protein